jgi:hypothetical protein
MKIYKMILANLCSLKSSELLSSGRNVFRKKSVAIAVLLLAFSTSLFAADFYWIGGTAGTWTAGSFSNTLGGASNAAVPGAADVVYFDAANIGGGVSGNSTSVAVSALPNSFSVGQLIIRNGTGFSITYTATSARIVTIAGLTGDDFIIQPGCTLNVGTNVSITMGASSTADISGKLAIIIGRTFNTDGTSVLTTVTGTIAGPTICTTASKLVFNTGSVYEHIANGGAIPTATWTARNNALGIVGATTLISGATTSAPTAATFAQAFGNLTWNSPNQTSSANLSGNLQTVNGNLTLVNTGTPSLEVRFTSTTAYTLNVQNDVVIDGGFFVTNSSTVVAPGGIVNIGGNLIVNPTGGFTVGQGGGTFAVNVAGTAEVYGIVRTNNNSASIGVTTISGNINVYPGGNFYVSNSTGTSTVKALSNINVNGGNFYMVSATGGTGGTNALEVTGNVNVTTGNFGSNHASGYNMTISGNLNIPAGGSVVLAAAQGASTSTSTRVLNLILGGNFNMTGGTFDGSTAIGTAATLRFTGTGKSFTQSGGTFISKLFTAVASGASLTFNSPYAIPVARSLSVAGAANFNSQPITFKSDATSTARLDAVTGTITGDNNVIIERFIASAAARRAWRLVTSPLRSTTSDVSVFNTWQLSGATGAGVAGKGTLITGPNYTGTDGLDANSGYSLKTFIGNALVGVDNTKTTPLFTTAPTAANKSYFLFVRGDRSLVDLTNVTQTTLSATGSLQVGDQVFTASSVAAENTLLGNPYPAPVDFALITKNNVVNRFYTWDPTLNTIGGYVTVDDAGNTGTYTITPVSGVTTQTQHIQSGQAVFIETATSAPASVTFTEGSKSTTITNNVFRLNGGNDETLSATLYLVNADNTTTVADGIVSKYNTAFSNQVDVLDAPKMTNINENLSIARAGKLLSIERRDLADNADTLFLNLSHTSARAYRFVFDAADFDAPLLTAFLEDAYLHTSSPVNLSAPTSVDFSITADPLSATANRFMIVFKTSGVLPVNYTAVKAYQQNAGIQVDWKVAAESNMRNYEVEKSTDGRSFNSAGTVAAKANNSTAVSYSWFDAAPSKGINYYRIKAVDNAGVAKYSQVVNVKLGGGKSEISIYPNPVVGKTISVQFTEQDKGTYTVNLFNNIGQVVFTKTIAHNGGSATQTISIGNAVSKGVYQMQVSNGEVKLNQQIVLN